MKIAIKYANALVAVFAIHGCGGGSKAICENPVAFSNEMDGTTFGYLVEIEQSIDAATEAARFMEQYGDFEIFSVYSSINVFHANSGRATLEQIRCESSVVSLSYNNAVGIS